MLDVLECSPSLVVSKRPGMSGVSGRLPPAPSGVAARDDDRSEDDITSYLKCSAKELLERWDFEEERRANAD